MSVSTRFVSDASNKPAQHTHPAVAATYLTWPAMVWTALLLGDQQAASARPAVCYRMVGKQLQVGRYSIGKDTDMNLCGHPEIRY